MPSLSTPLPTFSVALPFSLFHDFLPLFLSSSPFCFSLHCLLFSLSSRHLFCCLSFSFITLLFLSPKIILSSQFFLFFPSLSLSLSPHLLSIFLCHPPFLLQHLSILLLSLILPLPLPTFSSSPTFYFFPCALYVSTHSIYVCQSHQLEPALKIQKHFAENRITGLIC